MVKSGGVSGSSVGCEGDKVKRPQVVEGVLPVAAGHLTSSHGLSVECFYKMCAVTPLVLMKKRADLEAKKRQAAEKRARSTSKGLVKSNENSG